MPRSSKRTGAKVYAPAHRRGGPALSDPAADRCSTAGPIRWTSIADRLPARATPARSTACSNRARSRSRASTSRSFRWPGTRRIRSGISSMASSSAPMSCLPETVLAKYRIPYLFSVTDHLQALDRARTVDCEVAVPGHGPVLTISRRPWRLIDLNRSLINDVMDRGRGARRRGRAAEEILTRLLRHYDAPVTDAPGYYLLQPTVLRVPDAPGAKRRIRHEIRGPTVALDLERSASGSSAAAYQR